jgi:hypothetical protein
VSDGERTAHGNDDGHRVPHGHCSEALHSAVEPLTVGPFEDDEHTALRRPHVQRFDEAWMSDVHGTFDFAERAVTSSVAIDVDGANEHLTIGASLGRTKRLAGIVGGEDILDLPTAITEPTLRIDHEKTR